MGKFTICFFNKYPKSLLWMIAPLAFCSTGHAQSIPAPFVPAESPQVEGSSPQGASYATRAFSYVHKDVLAGDQAEMNLTRSYASRPSSVSHELPFGWAHNFDISIANHKITSEIALAANSLKACSPAEWPYQYTVIIGNRSIPFMGQPFTIRQDTSSSHSMGTPSFNLQSKKCRITFYQGKMYA